MCEPIPRAPGDALVLYTDGIFEARDAAGDLYGEERFHASVEAHAQRGAGAKELLAGLLADLEAFVGQRPMDDDVTCLVVRVGVGGKP